MNKEREKEIAAQWGQVAKTVVQNAIDHMQEHIHHVKKDLTEHMEECLEYRTAEISQQMALEAGADASAMIMEMIHHIRQNKEHAVQEAQKQASAPMIHVEQTAGQIIQQQAAGVVQEAKVHCANIQEQIYVFDCYLHSYSISDIKFKYLNGLNYTKYQFTRFNDFLSKKEGIKIFLEVDLIVSKEVHAPLNKFLKLNAAQLIEEDDDGI